MQQHVDVSAFLYFSNQFDNFDVLYQSLYEVFELFHIFANHVHPKKKENHYLNIKNYIKQTLTRDEAFNIIYLLFPRIFSVHITNHDTLLSCRTSFQ